MFRPFTFQDYNPVVRFLLVVEKFFSSREVSPSSLFNWQDEYRWDKAEKGRLLTRLLRARSESCLSFAVPYNWLPRLAAEETLYQMQSESQSLSSYISRSLWKCSSAMLRFFRTFFHLKRGDWFIFSMFLDGCL